jgi:CheY-like chemotaxis protein
MTDTVLVVDDAQFIRLTLKTGLQKVGFRILEAENGLEAEEMLSGHPEISLVLCDISMPEQDGVTTLENIRKKYPDMPVIMLTAYADKENVAICARLGICDFIAKPFDINLIRTRIFEALKKD